MTTDEAMALGNAVDALEQWRDGYEGRWYWIDSPGCAGNASRLWRVNLANESRDNADRDMGTGRGATLADAITNALADARYKATVAPHVAANGGDA